MKMDDMFKHKQKNIRNVKACPKCGNTDGIISIPGMGSTFYYCPKCPNKKPKIPKEVKRG